MSSRINKKCREVTSLAGLMVFVMLNEFSKVDNICMVKVFKKEGCNAVQNGKHPKGTENKTARVSKATGFFTYCEEGQEI
jgi:hypothetical protein